MSYDIKKLSEVEALTEVPEGANMIAEVGGQIKRVPAVAGEGGGSGGGVKTAIIKESTYDAMIALMTGKSADEPDFDNVTFSCTNMTFQEVYSAISAGEAVKIVGMFVIKEVGPYIADAQFMVQRDRIEVYINYILGTTMEEYTKLLWTENGIEEVRK